MGGSYLSVKSSLSLTLAGLDVCVQICGWLHLYLIGLCLIDLPQDQVKFGGAVDQDKCGGTVDKLQSLICDIDQNCQEAFVHDSNETITMETLLVLQLCMWYWLCIVRAA